MIKTLKIFFSLKNNGVLGACFMQSGNHKAGTALAVFFVGDKDEKACGFVRPTSESPNKFSFSVKKAQFVHVGKYFSIFVNLDAPFML